MKLKDKVALIAGGGQGIGEGIALCLAEEGAAVVIADIHFDNAEKVAEKSKALGCQALALSADLTKEEEVKKAVQKAIDHFKRIDILINNVGGVSQQMLKQIREVKSALGDDSLPEFMHFTAPIWDEFYRLNLRSHVLLSYAVIPHLIKQRSGTIINISSISGRLPEPSHIAYSSMKAGDISLTWSLAKGLVSSSSSPWRGLRPKGRRALIMACTA